MAPRIGFLVVCVTLTGLPGLASGQGLGGLGGGVGGGLGGAPASLSPLGAAGGPAALAAAPRTIWGFFGLSKANLAACKQQLCASQAGQMLNGMLLPASSMTGGLIPTCCPTVPTAAQVAALAAAGGPTGAEAVAAQIKRDEADAAARRAAIRYLSTADCHYWPEAEAAIIGGLRDDRNECVRYEAALALLNGCCCTAKTIEALNIVVSGSEKDGKPSETSERVRGIAMSALQGCLLRYHPPAAPIQPEPREPLEPAAAARPAGALSPGLTRVAYYYITLREVPPALVVAEANRTLERIKAAPPAQTVTQLTGSRSVYGALARAVAAQPGQPPARAETPKPAPAPSGGGVQQAVGSGTTAPPPSLRLNVDSPPASPAADPPPTAPAQEPFSAPPPPFRKVAVKPAEVAAAGRRPTVVSPSATLPPAVLAGDHPAWDWPDRATSKAAPPRPAAATASRRNLRDVFLNSVGYETDR